MNRERHQQRSDTNLVEEFWNLQNREPYVDANEFPDGPLSDPAEIELAVSTAALFRGRQQLGTTEYGRFLTLYYWLKENSRVTFQEFVKTRFIPEHVTSKGPAGRTHYRAILKHILKPETVDALFDTGAEITTGRLTAITDWPYLDDVRLSDLKPDHVRSVISAALGMGYSLQTVKHIRNVIGTIITHATKRRCFSGDNPAFQVPLPKMIRKKEEDLTLTQTKHLLGLMRYPEKEMALIAIFTGLNMPEICGLQWKHVNLTESSLNVDGSFIPPRSIAVKKQWSHRELDNVRESRIRNVEISEPMLYLFMDLIQKHVNVEPDDLVLVSRAGTALWPASILQTRLKPLGRELGMSRLSWHMFSKAHKTLLSELRMELTYHPKLSRQEAKPASAL